MSRLTFIKDLDGHLKNAQDWNESWAQSAALGLGLEPLSEEHHALIAAIRQLFSELNRVPSQRIFLKSLQTTVKFAAFSSLDLHRLFPGQVPLRALCLLAGLPAPQHCL